MRRFTLLAATAAALAIAGAAQAAAVIVSSTLDISQPQNGGPNFGGWRGFTDGGGAFSPSFAFDLAAGDSLDWTVDFVGQQTLTLVNPVTFWLFNFETAGGAGQVNVTGKLELLDASGGLLYASDVLTDTEGQAHFGQFFSPGNFVGLPSTVTFGGLHYTGTLNSYGAPDPYLSDPNDPNSPLIQDPTPTIRTYGDPDFAFTADGSSVNGGVPEPATWALMLSGFGLAGANLRRRRALRLTA